MTTHPEDIRAGQWVIIERIRCETIINELPVDTIGSPFAEQYLVDRMRGLQKFVGLPLWCTAVQFPFLFAAPSNDADARQIRFVFDFRNVVFAAIRPDVLAGLGLSATPPTTQAAAIEMIAAPQPLRIPSAESRGDHDSGNPAPPKKMGGEEDDNPGAAVPV